MKISLKSIVVTALLTIGVAASAAQDIRVYTADNQGGKINAASIEKAFSDAGFYITGNNDMNRAFEAKFKTHTHDAYNLMTLHHREMVAKIAKKYPSIVLFTPLSMSIYTKKGEKTISVSSMSTDGIAKVTGIPADNADLLAYGKAVADVLAKAMPNGKFETLNYKMNKPQGDLVNRFTTEMTEQGKDVEEALEGFQMEFEGELETAGFVMAGFNSLVDEFAKAGIKDYDFFDAYSICKVPVIFEVSKTHPEAGAFAPCTVYMFKKKGETVVHIAYPSVYNWMSSIDVDDKPSMDVLLKAQETMNAGIKEVTEE